MKWELTHLKICTRGRLLIFLLLIGGIIMKNSRSIDLLKYVLGRTFTSLIKPLLKSKSNGYISSQHYLL
jgi:hypothetical protein